MILRNPLRRLVVTAVAALAALGSGAALAAGAPAATDLDVAAREAAAELQVAPVLIDGRPIFRVAGLASTLPAEVRADRIAERIRAIADNPAAVVSTLRIETTGEARSIYHENALILGVTKPDAAFAGLDVDTAALLYVDRIGQAITQYRAERTPAGIRDAALRTSAAIAVGVLAIVLLLWGLSALGRAIDRRYHHRIQSVGIQSFELVRAERILRGISGAIAFARGAVVVVALFVLIDYVLMQFPWTRHSGDSLLGIVIAPIREIGGGLLTQIPNIAFLVILALVVRLLLKVLRLFFNAVAGGRVVLHEFAPEWADPTYKLLRFVIAAFALVVAYPYIPGSSSDAFKGISLFVGVVFSLASTTAIANLVAGYALIYRRAFKVGDRIRVGDLVGVVTGSRLQVTHLRTVKNEDVIVPNAQLLNGTIVNYSTLAAESGLVVSVTAGIGYETPWRQVEAMLLVAAERTGDVARDPPPFVWHLALGDFCVNYELNVFIHDALRIDEVRTALARNVLDVFNEYGVQIMTPAYMGDPREPKIVKPADFRLPPAAPAEASGSVTR